MKNNHSDLSKEELLQLISEKESLINNSSKEIQQLTENVDYLKLQIQKYVHLLYGKKSESIHAQNSKQEKIVFPEFGTTDLNLPQDDELQQITYKRNKPKKTRTDFSKLELPENLERIEVIVEPEHIPTGSVKIGEEVTELLACQPAKLYVKTIIRPKYALPSNEGIVVGALPTRVIPSGKVDVSVLVMLLIDKYIYHLPLHRQIKKYQQLGIELSDSTIGDWTAKSIEVLTYLYPGLRRAVESSGFVQADETTMKVLDKLKKGKSHLGYYWVYHAVKEKVVLFNYDRGRSSDVPLEMLLNFKGVLQTDGLEQYQKVGRKLSGLKLAGCMAHARRKFHDALMFNKSQATWMLEKYQELYAIEAIARDHHFTDAQRLEIRQLKSVTILNEMKQWMEDTIEAYKHKSNPITQACQYNLLRWERLIFFTTEGKVEIDNNLVENAIRPVALGRRNYMFAGSHEAAQRGAIIYSLFATCKRNGVDTVKWLEYVLDRILDTKQSELDNLLPQHFTEIFPA